MRSAAGLLALVIALLAAASCTSSTNGGGTTGADSSTPPTSNATGRVPGTGTGFAGPPAMTADGAAVLPDPSKRMLLGAYVELASQPDQAAAVRSREQAMGRPYDLRLTYYEWTDPFPDAGEQSIAANGSIPLMAWYLPGRNAKSKGSLSDITSGADDAWITRQAEAIKAFDHPVFLRLGPEMNGDWYGYSGHPAAFIAAWRHVHNLFARAGATNVTWVWCPNISPGGWDEYYPGSAYVDVVGVDGFSNVDFTWRTFEGEFDGFFRHMAAFTGKPQMVVETATNSKEGAPTEGVGSAASYISGMRSYLRDVAGPKYDVIGVCWFDTDTNRDLNNTPYNWLTDQTPQSWQAWLALARDPYFGGRGS